MADLSREDVKKVTVEATITEGREAGMKMLVEDSPAGLIVWWRTRPAWW